MDGLGHLVFGKVLAPGQVRTEGDSKGVAGPRGVGVPPGIFIWVSKTFRLSFLLRFLGIHVLGDLIN